MCVNDGAVMDAWAASFGIEDNNPDNYFVFMGDPESQLTAELSLLMMHPGPTEEKGLWHRGKRAAMFIDDGKVQVVRLAQAEDDPAGDDRPDDTLAPAMIKAINKYHENLRKGIYPHSDDL